MYRTRLKDGPQVVRMLQTKSGRSGNQEQKQNSVNLGTAFSPSPVLVPSYDIKLCQELSEHVSKPEEGKAE